MEKIIEKILKTLKVDLADEFYRNFSHDGFFSNKWKQKRDSSTSHLIKTDALRYSITAWIEGNAIIFMSATKYSAIHNKGGDIKITPTRQRFFWTKM